MRWWKAGLLVLSAMTLSAAPGWTMRQAHAQIVPAPRWCAEILDSEPAPVPIVDLFERVRAVIPAKGELETTAAFDQRTEDALRALRTALVGVYGSSRIAIQAPVAARYDPDRRSFDVRRIAIIPSTSWREAGPSVPQPDYDQVVVETREAGTGEYVGQNAHGATRTVQSRMQDDYGVALVNLRLAEAASWLRAHFIVPMPPDRAAAIGGKISVLIIGDLAAPGIVEGVSRKASTRRNPNDVTINGHYVAMTAACGAVVATSTREVLHRLN